MTRTQIGLGIASVLAGTTVLLVILGVVYNVVLLVFAIPIGFGAYLIWADVTGRAVFRKRTSSTYTRERRTTDPGRETTRGFAGGVRRSKPSSVLTSERAHRILGVDTDADDREITRAYRERVKEVHPDTPGGDEDAFKRVTAAYEYLNEP